MDTLERHKGFIRERDRLLKEGKPSLKHRRWKSLPVTRRLWALATLFGRSGDGWLRAADMQVAFKAAGLHDDEDGDIVEAADELVRLGFLETDLEIESLWFRAAAKGFPRYAGSRTEKPLREPALLVLDEAGPLANPHRAARNGPAGNVATQYGFTLSTGGCQPSFMGNGVKFGKLAELKALRANALGLRLLLLGMEKIGSREPDENPVPVQHLLRWLEGETFGHREVPS